MRLFTTCLVLFASLGSSARAEEPYEGRKLPESLKKILWAKACDVVPKQSVDCASERCIFKDSAGQAFKPDMQPWQTVLMYEWNVGGNVLTPTVVEGKLAGPDEVGDPRTALGLLSGLAVDLDPNDYLMQLNPAVIRWVGREFIPSPDTAMCGATAREVLCWWWMRRASTGSADELAMLFGKVLADYDAEALKKYAKAIPKPVALKPAQVTPKPLRKVDNPW